jgi:hypothetical protein
MEDDEPLALADEGCRSSAAAGWGAGSVAGAGEVAPRRGGALATAEALRAGLAGFGSA